MRYPVLALGQPTANLFAGQDDLPPSRFEWIQEQDRWAVLVYQHSGVAFMDGKAHAFGPMTALVFPPECRGGHVTTGRGTPHFYLVFRPADTDRERVGLSRVFACDDHDIAELWAAVAAISSRTALARAIVWRFLLKHATPLREAETPEAVARAEAHIALHLAEPISIARMCEELGVPHRTLLRQFVAVNGSTIQRYILERRGRAAVRLLTTGRQPIKQVAAAVGVPDPQQFNKLVRATAGASPRAIRARALG